MPGKNYIGLGDLMGAVGDTLQHAFGGKRIRIIAEVTDVKVYYQRSYAFLNLIEKEGDTIIAAAGAVIWRDNFHIIKDFEKATGVSFAQNLTLVLEVEVQFNARYGLRISVLKIDETYTLGKMEQDRTAVLNKLAASYPKIVWLRDGEYRSANKLLKLPLVAQKIALIAAPGSDGRRDFMHELANNSYGLGYSVAEFPAQVQGEIAAQQIATQLKRISEHHESFHAVALVRGGGGNTDFSAFDHFNVGLAVAACPLPVVTGIGHERNVSIADLLCFSAQKTPTKCAAGLTEHNLDFLAMIQNASSNLAAKARNMTNNYRQQMQHTGANIHKSALWLVSREKQKLQFMQEKLQLQNPQNTLERGYTLIYKNNNHVASSHALQAGDEISIRFADGNTKATIQS